MSSPSTARIVDVLTHTALLRDASREEIETLAAAARAQDLSEAEILFSKDSTPTSIYIVLRGRIRISSMGRNGGEFLLGTVEPGEIFGEMALVDEGRRAVTAIAHVDSTVVSLSRDVVSPILEQNPACSMMLMRIMAAHLRTTLDKLESVGLDDAKRRLWSKIVTLGRRYGRDGSEPDAFRVHHGLSQEQLGSSVGLTRVMVNRQLKLWSESGLITYGRGFVEIRDEAAFEDHVWSE